MENRKKQIKNHRRNVARKNTSMYGRSTKLQSMELSTFCSAINKNQHNRGPLASSSSSNSSSMKAFIFNTDSLGRNQYFSSFPKESTDRRIVKYHQSSSKAMLLKSPPYNMVMQNVFILGGVNSYLNFAKPHICDRTKLEYLQYLKKFSGKSCPSDRDIIFGNARKLLKESCGWENSRIQWLLELERRQEEHRARKQCYEEDLLEIICCFPFGLNMLT